MNDRSRVRQQISDCAFSRILIRPAVLALNVRQYRERISHASTAVLAPPARRNETG